MKKWYHSPISFFFKVPLLAFFRTKASIFIGADFLNSSSISARFKQFWVASRITFGRNTYLIQNIWCRCCWGNAGFQMDILEIMKWYDTYKNMIIALTDLVQKYYFAFSVTLSHPLDWYDLAVNVTNLCMFMMPKRAFVKILQSILQKQLTLCPW